MMHLPSNFKNLQVLSLPPLTRLLPLIVSFVEIILIPKKKFILITLNLNLYKL